MSDEPIDLDTAIKIKASYYRRQGRNQERERIIQALEDAGERYYISQETYDYVVSIIKGEDA
jgi:hypothetical protein